MAYPFDSLTEIAVADCETTGLDPESDCIVKLAVVLADLSLDPEQRATTFEATVNPGIGIPTESTKIHGLRDADVSGHENFGEIAAQLTEFIGDRPLVGFNVSFDKRFLNAELKRHGFRTFHRKRSHCVQDALTGIWGYQPSPGNALERLFLDQFTGKPHDPLNNAIATTHIAGMLHRLSEEDLAQVPGGRRTGDATAFDPPTRRQLDYIADLGGDPHSVETRQDASRLIDLLRTWDESDDPVTRIPERGRRWGGGSGCLIAAALLTAAGGWGVYEVFATVT